MPAQRKPIAFVDLRQEYLALKPELDSQVREIFASGQFILGTSLERFEIAFAHYSGVEHGVGVASGSAALELALRVCGIGPGDEVIAPVYTFVATAMSVRNIGATPVLVDVDEHTYTIDPKLISSAITSRTRAVIPVHLYGQPADMKPILALARKHDLAVIEDAAQAHGAEVDGRRVGSLGTAACFSFYPTKNLGAAGDAGMVVTHYASLARRLRRLRNHGRRTQDRFVETGQNERMDNLQAAILAVKLKYLDRWNQTRRNHALTYDKLLADLPLVCPAQAPNRRHVYHQYVIRCPRRRALAQHLAKAGIATAVHYSLPLHKQNAFAGERFATRRFQVATRLSRQVLSLPLHPQLGHADVRRVAAAVHDFF